VENIDNLTKAFPSFALIQELEDSLLRAAILRAALELDLFTIIAKGYRTLQSIVAATGYDERSVRTILEALCPMSLIIKSGCEFTLTPTSESFLVSDRPGYYGHSCLQTTLSLNAVGQIAESVRSGKALASHALDEQVGQLWAADFAPWLVTWPMEAKKARQMWGLLGERFLKQLSLQILDIGCGDGTKSLVLAHDNLGVRVTVMDLHEEVLLITKQIAEAMGVRSRIIFRLGDVLTSDFGVDEFDIVFFGSVIYFFNRDQVKAIFRRVFKSLKPSGLIVINHLMADEERCTAGPALLLGVQLLIFHPESHIYSFKEYEELLTQVGFTQTIKHCDSLLSAKKSETGC
jgi:2-polyprenyl-3-methyl-5-hydroxy-6-metoxy-1,4-benzoquinol methylase